ncbi:YcnI family protein [Amycolatopsis sp. CA-161197]|uniref:YcnI family copper-binding membrane protein n=1 Tax=Amycolatopsis sp. CA-161197 TaxID=3239922 RepID=UPI003D92DDEF
MSHHVFKRAGVLAATVGITGLLGAGIASAHVTANVYGAPATQGGYGAIFFRVPNEDAKLGTIGLEVDFKPEYGIGSVSTKPIPGWTAQVTKSTLPQPVTTASGTKITEAVTKVVWTADTGTKIGQNQFQEFEVSAGPLPANVDQLEFPTIQTYEAGKVVSWNETATAGGEEPEHPAPTIKLAAKSGGDEHAGMTASTTNAETQAAAVDSSDSTARWLGGAGLVVGALGLGFGVGAITRSRRTGNTEGTK